MTSPSDEQKKMEQLIHRTLRTLPPRRAPAALEQRVLAEILRRAELPWWRKSFLHWPLAARATFVVLSAGLVKIALIFGAWTMSGVDGAPFQQAFAQPLSWMENILAVFRAVTGFCEIILRNIPVVWLYVGCAFFGTMYLALFGLGAAAYKAIHTRR